MNERSLSEKLEDLALRLEESYEWRELNAWQEIEKIIVELRQLSKENYAPGNSMSWTDVKPKTVKKTFTDKSGKKLPF